MAITHEQLHERHESHSIPGLIRELRDQSIVLVRQEIELAKTELSEKATRVARNSAYAGVGTALIYAGVLFLLVAATGALTIGLIAAGFYDWAAPLAALIVGATAALIGALLAFKGKRAITRESPVPQRTVDSLKEDKEWAERKLKEGRR